MQGVSKIFFTNMQSINYVNLHFKLC